MAKQRRIALKLYEWVEKRPYFHKMARKKIRKKKVWSSIEPSTVKSYSSASGRFSHSGSHLMLTHLLSFLGIEEEAALVIDDEVRPFAFISNGSTQVELIDFRYTRSMRKRYTRSMRKRYTRT